MVDFHLEICDLLLHLHELLFVNARPFLSRQTGVFSVPPRSSDTLVERFMESFVTPTDEGFQGLLTMINVREVTEASEDVLTHIHVRLPRNPEGHKPSASDAGRTLSLISS